jgi:hypothetical protein
MAKVDKLDKNWKRTEGAGMKRLISAYFTRNGRKYWFTQKKRLWRRLNNLYRRFIFYSTASDLFDA